MNTKDREGAPKGFASWIACRFPQLMGHCHCAWPAAVVLFISAASPAMAHSPGYEWSGETNGWNHWNWDLLILASLLLLSLLYGIGAWKLRARAGPGRGVTRSRMAAFAIGMFFLFAALVSPIDFLAAELLWVHMMQHMLLMNMAAPLLVLGMPFQVSLWVLPSRGRSALGRWKQWMGTRKVPFYLLWQPLLLWSLYAMVLWIWHLPALYESALRNDAVHDLQHLSFVAAACLFWRVLLDPVSRYKISRLVAVIYLFTTSLHATALGVFLGLSPQVWYGFYAGRTEKWGWTALEDQQVAGFLMWMPACMMYALVAALLLVHWLYRLDAQENAVPVQNRLQP